MVLESSQEEQSYLKVFGLDTLEKILLDVKKPSRYIGNEQGCSQKRWESSKIRLAFAFPDLYEVGISNLGLRVLYNIVNNIMGNDFYADRVYAPDKDFKEKLEENNLSLYGLESFKPLNEFDFVAFSLQYELSYPTVLAMLNMADVPIINKHRNESHPIIIAGGPCCYNPEPMADFIDLFTIGDGEEINMELLEKYKKLKNKNLSREKILFNLAQLEGVYVPAFYEMKEDFSRPVPIKDGIKDKIKKRIVSGLKIKNCPENHPVPYTQGVHDRAVIEVRRGCGRMCRFCQPGHVNLPVREQDSTEVVNLAEKLLRNTGYDEYSLLSLSSSDYNGIEPLVCALSNKFDSKGISISLPSQRADNFSLNLAEMVQSVRKSTLTFAPEAGSQRMRNIINKNLTEEQILDAVMAVYQAGWKNVKLYFMIGLPFETYEDLDGILFLLKNIKDKSKEIRKEKNLPGHLDVTCTVSIFVPKSFTPFQWWAQDSKESISEKISYLKSKIKYIKGVKLKFHAPSHSQLEAVLAKGDRNLCKIIEKVYNNGAYLDPWDEYFNIYLWQNAFDEAGINIEEYSCRILSQDDLLPWDIIDTGIDKNWLKTSYQASEKESLITCCEDSCSNCGICKNMDAKKIINKGIPQIENCDKINIRKVYEKVFRYRLKLQKIGFLRYISHLDWQKLLYKAFKKSGISLNFTKGFNPLPKISIGLALVLFLESETEFADIELIEELQEEELLERLNQNLPEESKILKVEKICGSQPVVDKIAKWAKYTAQPIEDMPDNAQSVNEKIDSFLKAENLFIEKINFKKKTKKIIDIKPGVQDIKLNKDKLEFVLRVGQAEKSDDINIPIIKPNEFLEVFMPGVKWRIRRVKLMDRNLKELK